jgi:hypothetical protein
MRGLLIAVIGALTISMSATADTAIPRGNWNMIKELPAGSSLELQMSSGDVIYAEFSRLLEDAIMVTTNAQLNVYPRTQVAEIRLIEKISRGRKAAQWGAVGFALGFGGACAFWGILTKGDDTIASDFIKIGTLAGAVAGGTSAFLSVTRSTSKRTVIYRAAQGN